MRRVLVVLFTDLPQGNYTVGAHRESNDQTEPILHQSFQQANHRHHRYHTPSQGVARLGAHRSIISHKGHDTQIQASRLAPLAPAAIGAEPAIRRPCAGKESSTAALWPQLLGPDQQAYPLSCRLAPGGLDPRAEVGALATWTQSALFWRPEHTPTPLARQTAAAPGPISSVVVSAAPTQATPAHCLRYQRPKQFSDGLRLHTDRNSNVVDLAHSDGHVTASVVGKAFY